MLIILNPSAGRGRGARFLPLIEKRLPDVQIVQTTHAGEAETLAHDAARSGERFIVAGGGDGTLSEVLNGVMSANVAELPTLGVLPLGTGNDFARTLGIGTDVYSALQILAMGEICHVNVGEAELSEGTRGEVRRFWLNVCGAGIDSKNAARINAARHHPFWRHIKGTSAYLVALAIELWHLKATNLRLSIDGETIELRTVLCAVANARSYGGGMMVAPQAEVDDGLLDVVLIEEVGRLEFLRAFPGVFKGAHLKHPKVKTFRGAQIRLESEPPLPVLVDGEVLGTTPASFRVGTQTIGFLAPLEG